MGCCVVAKGCLGILVLKKKEERMSRMKREEIGKFSISSSICWSLIGNYIFLCNCYKLPNHVNVERTSVS